jgi:amidase
VALAREAALTVSDLDCYSTARAMAAAVAAKEISARELLELHLARIAEVNPAVNAVVSLDEERARAGAVEADARLARGEEVGVLHGLPHAFKDTHEVAGWRTTFGSPLRADYVPKRDDLIAERIRRAGAVTIGKTNVPEWAAGSHTFNPIFGTTRNPYDLTRSAGGSSGGAAAALASGMVPLAEGSDMGGSLRNPASFNNVVGLRPGVGRVPSWPTTNGWELTSVGGPMARSVEDLALLLSVVAGPSRRAPLSLEAPGSSFAPPLQGADLAGARVALSVDLGGAFRVDRAVADVVGAQAAVLEGLGAVVEDAHPVLHSADAAFRTLRAWVFHARFRSLLDKRPDDFKQSLRDNILLGADLSGADIAKAYQQLTSIHDRMRAFFEVYDVLALPVSQVPPFSADEEYPSEINGQTQESYLDWMRSAYLITVTGCPAISVPAGFTPEGWPVGIQLVGPVRGERRLLEIAHTFEQATRVGDRRPPVGVSRGPRRTARGPCPPA